MKDKISDNLEKTVRKTFMGYSIVPSPDILRKIRFRLAVSDFFSIRPRKFNMVYASLIVGGLTCIILFHEKSGSTVADENSTDLVRLNERDRDDVAVDQKIEPASSKKEVETEASMLMPVARFESDFVEGCAPLKVQFFNKSAFSENMHWDFGNGKISEQSDPVHTFSEPGMYEVTLRVSNNAGKDIYLQKINVLSTPKAEFSIDINNSAIAERKIVFRNQSEGGEKYIWDFGDATHDTGHEIQHFYKDFDRYDVSLIAIGSNGCMDTITHSNNFIEKNYELYFPVTFRPNPNNKASNGFYEKAGQESSVFYPNNFGASNYELCVYAPNGMEIFKTTNIKQGWNGFIRGRIAPGGVYSYKAQGIYPNGKPFLIRGKVRLIVDEFYQN